MSQYLYIHHQVQHIVCMPAQVPGDNMDMLKEYSSLEHLPKPSSRSTPERTLFNLDHDAPVPSTIHLHSKTPSRVLVRTLAYIISIKTYMHSSFINFFILGSGVWVVYRNSSFNSILNKVSYFVLFTFEIDSKIRFERFRTDISAR